MNNSPVSPESLVSALSWRYATKTFDASKKIPEQTWSALEQSLVLSPSSFGLQPWKFIVVTDPAVKAKLREKAWNQSQVTDCSHYVVIAAKSKVTVQDVERFIAHTAAVTGAPLQALEGYKGMMIGFVSNASFDTHAWAEKQSYIALGFLLESAALLGVDACPMEGFDRAAFDQILGLPAEGYNATVTCAVGYRSAEDKSAHRPKVRYSRQDVVKHVK